MGNFAVGYLCAEVAELADARDLGSRAARRVGSSPTFGTSKSNGRLLTGAFFGYYSADRK